MNVPFDLMFGVDVAIKKLRPHAQFSLYGTQFHDWVDPTGAEPPSWEEVMEQMAKDENAYKQYCIDNGIPLPEWMQAREQQPQPDQPPELNEEENFGKLSKSRYTICKSCDEFNDLLKLCKQCNCLMLVKVKLADSECPLGKW